MPGRPGKMVHSKTDSNIKAWEFDLILEYLI